MDQVTHPVKDFLSLGAVLDDDVREVVAGTLLPAQGRHRGSAGIWTGSRRDRRLSAVVRVAALSRATRLGVAPERPLQALGEHVVDHRPGCGNQDVLHDVLEYRSRVFGYEAMCKPGERASLPPDRSEERRVGKECR